MSILKTSRRSFLSTLTSSALALMVGGCTTLQPKKSTQNLEQLISSLKSIKDLQVGIPNDLDPNKKTVLLYKDIHYNDGIGGPEQDFELLEQIRAKTGINQIAMEGWAGSVADEQRGRVLMNGQDQLVRQLIADSNYQVTALEDPVLQGDSLIGTYFNLQKLMNTDTLNEFRSNVYKLNSMTAKLNKRLQFIKQYELAVRNNDYQFIEERSEEYERYTIATNTHELKESLEIAKTEFNESLEPFAKDFGMQHPNANHVLEKAKYFFSERYPTYRINKSQDGSSWEFDWERFKQEIRLDKRSEVAVQKYLAQNIQEPSIIFYGIGHHIKIKSMMKATNDYNVISISPKGQDERRYSEYGKIYDDLMKLMLQPKNK